MSPTQKKNLKKKSPPRTEPKSGSQPSVERETCPRCEKILELCVCAEVRAHDNRHSILILQHPQEPDKHLGTAKLAHLALKNSQLKIGLSWRNLNHALGLGANAAPKVPKKWGVLYLGSGIRKVPKESAKSQLLVVNKNGEGLQESNEILSQLEGIVILDGTWSQAKTHWWRNAWLLKLHRVVARPQHPSLYKELRKEPRRECLSTLETAALALEEFKESPIIARDLRTTFTALLDKRRALGKSVDHPKKPDLEQTP